MASKSPEWKITVTQGSTVKMEQENNFIDNMLLKCKSKVFEFAQKAWKIGEDDPRKFYHCIKVGLALALVSIFYYTRLLYNGVGGAAMWAVMTVVVIFEFTVGGSFYKGLNRAFATLSAGALACGVHWLASKSGETMEHVILGASIFILSSGATFSRFLVPIKEKFDYGIMIFILTFNFVAISSYRIDNLISLIRNRVSTIAIGVFICLIVSVVVSPVWAGEDLHKLIIRNMEKLAESLEYSVTEYFRESETLVAAKSSCQKSNGYKSVLNSKASEDSLAILARWEPSHGIFKLRHPWNQYLKVGAAMRYCAYSIEALNGFINSDIQAPRWVKEHFTEVCTKLSTEYCRILKESAYSLKEIKKSSTIELMMVEMNEAVEEVYNVLKSFKPTANESHTEGRKESVAPLGNVKMVELLPLISVVSLLIEIAARIEGIVDEVEDLAELACFRCDSEEKEEYNKPEIRSEG